MKEEQLKLASIIDSLYKITHNEQGKIVLWKAEMFKDHWTFQHCCDIKAEWLSFSSKHNCTYFLFCSALQMLADTQNAFE
jgi:hypothetical protein